MPNILVIFHSIFALCAATITPGVVLGIFLRKNSSGGSSSSLLKVIFENAVRDLNSEAKAYSLKARRKKKSATIGVINEIES